MRSRKQAASRNLGTASCFADFGGDWAARTMTPKWRRDYTVSPDKPLASLKLNCWTEAN
jgi:hypothetical protein